MSEHIMHTYPERTIELVGGAGARVSSTTGDSYIDLVAGIAVSSLGHGHPDLVGAIAQQAERLVHVSNLYETPPQRDLARRLFELTDGMKSFFCNSGAEAVETALKIARKRREGSIVCATGSFHGRTFGALSATGQEKKRRPFEPLLDGFVRVPYGDADALAQVFERQRVSAVLLEPIQGEAGVIVPPSGYLSRARELCDRAGALLMLDEVQTGVGRTGQWWAWRHEGVRPDVMSLAKGLAGGLPIGACLARGEAAGVLVPGDHASTFGGGPVQCAAACTVIDVIERDGLLQRVKEAGTRLVEELERLWPGAEVRGRGLLIGVDLGIPSANEIVERAAERGVLINAATERVIRVSPPLVITDEEIDEAVALLGEVADEVPAA